MLYSSLEYKKKGKKAPRYRVPFHGYIRRLPYDLPDYVSPFVNKVSDEIDTLVERMEQIRDSARDNLQEATY